MLRFISTSPHPTLFFAVSLVEAHDEFGVTNATSTRPKSSFSPRKPLPRATKAANDAEIPETESAMRTNVMHAVGTLDIREHRHPIDPAEHPAGGGTLTLSNAQQWALVHHDDFSTNAEGWFISKDGVFSNENVNDKRQGCNGNPDLHLGGYCAFSGIEVSKTFNNLPAHSFVQITARVHFFDYWRGEYAFAKVNNNVVWQQSHAFCSKPFVQFCKGVDSCGDNKYSDKLSQLVKIAIPHTGSSITVSFGSSLHVDACTASWAVDDVAVWTKF